MTLRNFGWLTVAMLIAFIGLSFDRRIDAEGYGRIMDKQMAPNDDVRPKVQPIVTEAPPVADQTAADPLLLAPAAREQEFLSTDSVGARALARAAMPMAAPTQTAGGSVSIVGGSDGVVIIRNGESANRPLLAGGIFKQQP